MSMQETKHLLTMEHPSSKEQKPLKPLQVIGGSGSVEDKEDAFTVTIGKDYMTVTGFSYDATIVKIETWADSQTNLA